MSKGEETRETILRKGLDLASEVGLEALTLGSLADRVGMSKSGLYAHFKSKAGLQREVLDAAADLFVETVVRKAIKKRRGLPRLRALFDLWLDWGSERLTGGCPFIAAAAEFDDRSGPVRDALVYHLREATGTISRAARTCVEEGHFRRELDLDQFAFEFWSILLSYHLFRRLMRQDDARARANRALDDLIRAASPA